MITQNLKLKTKNHNLKLKANLRERTYDFSLAIIQFVNGFPNRRVYWVISDQLLRASTSIGANIIEAKSSSSKRDFIKFYQIALKSANETEYWLRLLKDSKLVLGQEVDLLTDEVIQISRMLGSSILTLKGKKF